jgi:hypothetical protein
MPNILYLCQKHLINALALTYLRLPRIVRRFIRINFESLIFRFNSLISNLYSIAFLINGKEKYGKKDLSILYFGDKTSVNYFINLAFSEKPQLIKLKKKIYLWNINNIIKEFSPTINAIFIKNDRFFTQFLQNKGFIIIPEWIKLILDVSDSLPAIYEKFNKSTRKDFKKMINSNYDFEITNDYKKIDFFYKRMFIPFNVPKMDISSILGLIQFWYYRILFDECKLILVKNNDKYVSGGLIYIENDIARFPCMGILDGNAEYIEKGAATALKYFQIIWAKKERINRLDFGHTRAFLNDGLFRFKRKWGMHLEESNNIFGIFGMKIVDKKSGIQEFLTNNPFIYFKKNKLEAIVYIKKNHPITQNEIKKFSKKYFTKGLYQLIFISNQGFTSDAKTYAALKYSNKIIFIQGTPDKIIKQIFRISNKNSSI